MDNEFWLKLIRDELRNIKYLLGVLVFLFVIFLQFFNTFNN